jgi:aspartate/methionine/tyrosine aminotransferase
MQMPRIPLFDWLVEYLPKTKIDLANSSITGVPFDELIDLTGFEIPNDLNMGKNDPFGAKELRSALAEMYNCEENNIVTTTGGSEANFLVFLGLLEAGDEVLVEQPGYSPLWLVPQALGLGVKVKPWPRRFTEHFRLDLDELENLMSNTTKLIVITNLHNPSGVTADYKSIVAAAKLAADYGAYLFIDEMFLDVANTPQRSAAMMESVIVTASVSKVYGIGGLRTGWIIAEDAIARQCLQAKWQTTVASPYISELITAAALSNAKDKLINRCKRIAKQNFPIVEDWIRTHGDLISWIPPDGGILSFPKFNSNKTLDSLTICQKLIDEHGVLISPGDFFGSEGHFRLTYMNPEPELTTGLNAITDVLKSVAEPDQ